MLRIDVDEKQVLCSLPSCRILAFPDELTVLTFSLDDSVGDVFDISSNGTITTKKLLDRETVPFYAFQVSLRKPAFSLIFFFNSKPDNNFNLDPDTCP